MRRTVTFNQSGRMVITDHLGLLAKDDILYVDGVIVGVLVDDSHDDEISVSLQLVNGVAMGVVATFYLAA